MQRAFGLPSILPEPRASSGLTRSHGFEPSSHAAITCSDTHENVSSSALSFSSPHPCCRSNGRNCALQSATSRSSIFGKEVPAHAGATSLFCRWAARKEVENCSLLGARPKHSREPVGKGLAPSCLGQGQKNAERALLRPRRCA